MLQRKFFLACLFVLLVSKSFTQVNLQTGGATFSLPVFKWQHDKSRLNALVALSYTSGNGLKVNDIASNVGQGWSMVAGGTIVRMQVGEPDDQPARNGNGTEYDLTKYPAGMLYASVPGYNGCPTALTRYPVYGWKNQLYTQHNVIAEDKQLDYFSFQFNGKAGMFVLDPANIGVALPLGDTKMKITFQTDNNLINLGIRTRITSFSIQDIDGLIYKFARHGLTKVLETAYCEENLTHKRSQPKFEGNKVYFQSGFESPNIINPWVIGSWYLTEIEDPFTHAKVFFNYTTRNINAHAGQDIVHTHDRNYSTISHKKTIAQTPVITSMVFPDGHNVTFNYGAARADLNGDYILSSVDVTYNSRFLSKHLFGTSYFILNRYGNPVTDYQKKSARLCLRSVQKIGPDLKEDSPPYLFDYYTGSNAADDFVPPPFFYAKDIWGFYNGSNSVSENNTPIPLNISVNSLNNSQAKGLCFMNVNTPGPEPYLNPKAGYAKNGLLRQIIYPTGGTVTYQYAQNTGVLGGVTRNVGGVHVYQTNSTDGGYTNTCAAPLTTQYNFILSGGASSLWGIEMPVNRITTSNHYQPEYKYYKWAGCFPFGCCDWKFKYPGILSSQQAVDLVGFKKFLESIAPVLNVVNVLSTISDVVNLCLSATPLAIVSVVIDVICGLVTLALTCFGNQARDKTYVSIYSTDLNGAAPLPAQFKRVEVVENPGTIGKTVHEFTSDDDYPMWVPSNPLFTAKQRFAPWAYGLSKKETAYNASGNKVKETENLYNFIYAQSILKFCWGGHPGLYCNQSGLYTNLVSCKCVVSNTSSQRNTTWSDPNVYNNPASYIMSSNSDLKVDMYAMYSGRVDLHTTYERSYKADNPSLYVQNQTNYLYNTDNYELERISTTDYDGTIKMKYFRYTNDFNTGLLATLKTNNVVAEPVVTSMSVYKNYAPNSWQEFYLGEQVVEYATLANGDIRPYRTLEQRFDKPMPTYNPGNPTFQQYLGPGNPSNPAYKEATLMFFNASSKMSGMKDEGNRFITNIYGHSDKYIVATVLNADPVNDKTAYTSFEDDGGNIGWTLNTGSAPATYSSSSATGARSLIQVLGVSNVALITTSKPYTLSFWATNGSTSVSATGGTATQTKSAPTINGFTYYEYDISQGASSVTVAGGNATIDELRLYPRNSRMRSITYDPIIGKTSECDENNRISYYEYDNLGRMRFIKDENRNIVNMYEYNNVSPAKQNGCPGTYGNKLISETFVKSNCGPGYIGSEVTYTIAANTYTSALSQADADAKAENALLTSGQGYANTNGTCIQVFSNTVQSQNFTTENCPIGYIGGTVTYTVPAGRYTSLISQTDANQKALDEIAANGDAYANNPLNAVCTITTNPIWEWPENGSYYCLTVGGQLPAHLFVLETDINPYSSSYGQTRWSDVGPSDLCPAGTYYSQQQSSYFQKNDCPSGQVGSMVLYTIPPGQYSSTTSQAAADQLALNALNAGGQSYANTNGTCSTPCNSYKVTLPWGTTTTNLYIEYYPCGSATPVTLSWEYQIVLDWDGSATICTGQGGYVGFRYGQFGYLQDVGATFEWIGTCF